MQHTIWSLLYEIMLYYFDVQVNAIQGSHIRETDICHLIYRPLGDVVIILKV